MSLVLRESLVCRAVLELVYRVVLWEDLCLAACLDLVDLGLVRLDLCLDLGLVRLAACLDLVVCLVDLECPGLERLVGLERQVREVALLAYTSLS